MKLAMPQRACKGITVNGRDYDTKTGIIEVSNPADARSLIANGGCFPVSNQPAAGRKGWVCAACGFATWFKKCGRCGGHCERE